MLSRLARTQVRTGMVARRAFSSARVGAGVASGRKIGGAVAGVAGLSAGLFLLNEQQRMNRADCLFGGAQSGSSIPHHGVPGTNQERTFLAIKPDGVQRGIVGDVIARFEKRGYKLVGLKMVWPTKQMAENHYADLSTKPFFKGLTEFFSSGPIVCMCWEGKDVIRQGRQMLGETDPLKSKPGSIRGDYSIDLGRNIIHGSDGPESAEHELNMWFKKEEMCGWAKTVDSWVYEK